MSEREIFLAALELPDPADRERFLDQACAGDAVLRAAVEALFKSHQGAGKFLQTPLVPPANPGVEDSGTPAASSAAVTEPTVQLSREQLARQATDDETEGDERSLGFLSPSIKPGSLGRLAHYEVLEVLGRGAFGTVLKAFDEKLHRMVAIKVMSAELAATSPARKRFLREARSSAAIRHENVVAIHAVEEQPLPYLVMEYIPGQTLQQALDSQGPFDLPDILRLGQQIASGLAAAHSQGLIHRDIKPANILLEEGIQWKVKLTDFGLARAADDASVTQSGMIAGTPMFMSPEQAHTNQIDQRSDLFSFGSVLYQMTSGRPPFRAPTTLAVLKRVTEETPHPIKEIIPETPDWLCTIISRLHEKRPEDRYQTAQEVADLLARCQAELQLDGKVTCVPGRPGAAPETHVVSKASGTPSTPDTNLKPSRSTNGYWIAAVLLLFAVTGGLLNHFKPTENVEKGREEIPVANTFAVEQPAGWHGWPADAPKPAIAPFDADDARQHQEAWAKYLNVPVEYENSLGMKFRLIPPGEFLMGSSESERDKAIAELQKVRENPDTPDYLRQDVTDQIESEVPSEGPQHATVLTTPWYEGDSRRRRLRSPASTSKVNFRMTT